MAKAKKSTAKAAKGGGKSKGGAAREVLIVGSKMKDAIRKNGLNVAGDAIQHLNEKVHALIEHAVHRTTTNGRKTVRGHDF